MRDRRTPRWPLALSWLPSARYRTEILDDLLDERLSMIDRGRSRVIAGSWLFVHIVRSALAGPRRDDGAWRHGEASRGTSISAALIQDARYATRSLARRPRSVFAAT